MKILDSPGNGNQDIYRVDAKIIEDLKPKELKLGGRFIEPENFLNNTIVAWYNTI